MTISPEAITEAPAATTWRAVFRSLLVASKRINRGADEILSRCGISLAELRLLALLDDRGPLCLGEISELLYYGKSNITRLVDRLEAERFVQRQRDTHDRRSIEAVITEEGRSTLGVARRAMEEASWGLGRLSAAQRQLLVELLEQVTN